LKLSSAATFEISNKYFNRGLAAGPEMEECRPTLVISMFPKKSLYFLQLLTIEDTDLNLVLESSKRLYRAKRRRGSFDADSMLLISNCYITFLTESSTLAYVYDIISPS